MMIKPQVMAQHVLRNQALAVTCVRVLCALCPVASVSPTPHRRPLCPLPPLASNHDSFWDQGSSPLTAPCCAAEVQVQRPRAPPAVRCQM